MLTAPPNEVAGCSSRRKPRRKPLGNRMPLDLATLGPKPDTTPDANAFGSQSRLNLVFGAAAVAAHHYDARHKLTDDVDQVRLSGHHVVDVFIGTRNLVQPARE